jgi:hypothetical protein
LFTPIPTFTLLVAPFTPLTDPSTRQLLQSTREFAPIAVALLRLPADALASAPKAVLELPLVLAESALYPIPVLLVPTVLRKALNPLAVLLLPD